MISLVIPCYNEENNIFPMYELMLKTFKDYKKKIEIIFVNDGSKDKTMNNLRKIVKDTKEIVKVIDFSRNFGKESAIYAGLSNATGDYVAIIDADLQQDPKYVLDAVNFLEDNIDYDCVTFYQEKRKDGFLMGFIKKSFYRVINAVSEVKFINDASDFRVLKRNMVNSILDMKEHYRFSKGLFSWVGFNVKAIPYEVKERNSGTTKWKFKGLVKYAIDGILSFTTSPLKISIYLGLILLLFSLVYLIIGLVNLWCYMINFSSDAVLLILLLFLSGLNLLSLGIIGEYVGRGYVESKNRPIYIAREIIKSRDK
jgi:glycosyltransferase involved in cell wall biosynthesis